MPGLLLDHVLAHLSLGGDCRRVAVRSAITGGRSNRVTTPWALNTISGRDFTIVASIALAVGIGRLTGKGHPNRKYSCRPSLKPALEFRSAVDRDTGTCYPACCIRRQKSDYIGNLSVRDRSIVLVTA